MTASEPSNYTFSQDASTGMVWSISAYSGVDRAKPVDDFSGRVNGNKTAFIAPAATSTSGNDLAVWFGTQLWTGSSCPVGGAQGDLVSQVTAGAIRSAANRLILRTPYAVWEYQGAEGGSFESALDATPSRSPRRWARARARQSTTPSTGRRTHAQRAHRGAVHAAPDRLDVSSTLLRLTTVQ